jgi:2'-deoxynucleoside 5'-phosphate N-hydrolase
MKAYVAVSYTKRRELEAVVAVIRDVLLKNGIMAFVFVDNYTFGKTSETAMMQQAFADIEAADFFIAETSEKAIGIGVEAGYAKGKGKTVIYLRHQAAEHSTTVAGASDFQIIYDSTGMLKEKLNSVLKNIPL